MHWPRLLFMPMFWTFQSAPISAQDNQSAAEKTPPPALVSARPVSTALCDCIVIPALMIVDIEIVNALSSRTAKDGDTFPIRLSSPIYVDGRVVVPAGATGLGEVIHAQKSGMGGGGGELLLAARYVEVNGQRLRLRSFRAGRYGKNQTAAALATTYAFGVFGLAVTGKNTEFAAGSVAEAKVAEAFDVPLSALPPQAIPQPEPAQPVPEPGEPHVQPVSSKESNP
jgi:hypothetical protein